MTQFFTRSVVPAAALLLAASALFVSPVRAETTYLKGPGVHHVNGGVSIVKIKPGHGTKVIKKSPYFGARKHKFGHGFRGHHRRSSLGIKRFNPSVYHYRAPGHAKGLPHYKGHAKHGHFLAPRARFHYR